MVVFIFDVDGTLTPSRRPMNAGFKEFFKEFVKNNYVVLATGSEQYKTVEQIGLDLYNMIPVSYNCAGNQVFEYGVLKHEEPILVDNRLMDDLYALVERSTYPERNGKHIELRPGIVNFSTVGRNSDDEARHRYKAWDDVNKQRLRMQAELTPKWGHLYEFNIGGEISIDIYPVGKNKAQIRNLIQDDVVFFGDQTQEGGNDHALAKALRPNDKLHQVLNWGETKAILETQYMEK